jgi:hypothetical protein
MRTVLSSLILLALSLAPTPAAAWEVAHVLASPSARDIWVDAPDNIWVVSNAKLLHFDGADWTTIDMEGEFPSALGGDGGLIYIAGDRLVTIYDPADGSLAPIGTLGLEDGEIAFRDYTSIVAFGLDRVILKAE